MKHLLRFLQRTATVARWEFRAFWLRPSGYVLLLGSALLAAWSFSWLVTLLSQGAAAPLRAADDPIAQFLGPNVFLIAGCTLLVPLLTMNAVADERRRGSWETLVTAPVSALEIVVGKFAALWTLFLVCLSPWPYFLLALRGGSRAAVVSAGLIPGLDGPGVSFDFGPVLGGIIALAVVGATFVALGLFCSSLCRNPRSAALLSLTAMGIVLLLGFAPRMLEYWHVPHDQAALIESISCWKQVERFSRGVIEPRVIAAHVSCCATLLSSASILSRRIDEK